MREDGDRIQPLTVEELIQQYSKEDKIDHLLQVDNFYGGSKRSGKKLIIAILLASLPILFTRGVLFFLLQFVRFKYAVSIMAFVYLLYVVKVLLLIVGNEDLTTFFLMSLLYNESLVFSSRFFLKVNKCY